MTKLAKIRFLLIAAFAVHTAPAAACTGISAAGRYFDVDTGFHWDVLGEFLKTEHPDGIFPKTMGPMCSFVMAGADDDVNGTPVAPVGERFLVQTIMRIDGCSPSTDLVVADCETVEAVLIHGRGPYPEGDIQVAGFSPSLIGHHLVPEGQLDVAAAGSIRELERHAKNSGLTTQYVQGANHVATFFMEPDAIDPFCGCKIYHPDSAGAQQ